MATLPLADIAIKADAYADHLDSVEGLKAALRIVAQNVRDADNEQRLAAERLKYQGGW